MFNRELKERFLNEYTKSVMTVTSSTALFNAVSPYESRAGKDVCSMSVEELQTAVDGAIGIRTSSKYVGFSVLREYVRWCVQNGVPGAVYHFDEINMLGLDKVRLQMVANPLHLQKYLDSVFDPESNESVECTYRCWFWMAFAGIQEDRAIEVTRDQVNLLDMEISLDSEVYPIYKEGIKAFRNAASLGSFAYRHPLYKDHLPRYRDRVPGNKIMRGVKADARIEVVRPTVSKFCSRAAQENKTSQKLSYNRVWLSGYFYRAYEMERIGYEPDFTELALRSMGDKEYALGKNSTYTQKKNAKIRELAEDYNRWKLAFQK